MNLRTVLGIDVKIGMQVKIKGILDCYEDNGLLYSTYSYMQGKVTEILDDNYVLVDVPEKLKYNADSLAKVPILQLEKIDNIPIFQFESINAKMKFIAFKELTK